jgi:four helix bundle protein
MDIVEDAGPIKSVNDLKVYGIAYSLAMDVFNLSKTFPKDEQYALTSQIKNSSRSVPANIREGFAKRKYPNIFIRHLVDAYGSSEETRTWLDMSRDSNFLNIAQYNELSNRYEELSRMLYSLIQKWEKYD